LFASTGQSSGSSEVHAAKCSAEACTIVPGRGCGPIIASDRHALESDGVVDNPDHRVHTATLGLRIFHTMKMPIRDPGGRPRYLLSISTDVTERKLGEQAIQELNSALVSKRAAHRQQSGTRELQLFGVP